MTGYLMAAVSIVVLSVAGVGLGRPDARRALAARWWR